MMLFLWAIRNTQLGMRDSPVNAPFGLISRRIVIHYSRESALKMVESGFPLDCRDAGATTPWARAGEVSFGVPVEGETMPEQRALASG